MTGLKAVVLLLVDLVAVDPRVAEEPVPEVEPRMASATAAGSGKGSVRHSYVAAWRRARAAVDYLALAHIYSKVRRRTSMAEAGMGTRRVVQEVGPMVSEESSQLAAETAAERMHWPLTRQVVGLLVDHPLVET